MHCCCVQFILLFPAAQCYWFFYTCLHILLLTWRSNPTQMLLSDSSLTLTSCLCKQETWKNVACGLDSIYWGSAVEQFWLYHCAAVVYLYLFDKGLVWSAASLEILSEWHLGITSSPDPLGGGHSQSYASTQPHPLHLLLWRQLVHVLLHYLHKSPLFFLPLCLLDASFHFSISLLIYSHIFTVPPLGISKPSQSLSPKHLTHSVPLMDSSLILITLIQREAHHFSAQ